MDGVAPGHRRVCLGFLGGGGLAALAAALAGCSLLLDFSEPELPKFSEEECALGEPNDLPEEAAPLSAEPVAAALCRGSRERPDTDFFSLTVPPGQSITQLSLRFTQKDKDGNLDLYLYDAAGNVEFGRSTSEDSDERITCPSSSCISPLEPGSYLVEVRESITSLVGNRYTLELMVQ
jgi:hypothetical protein